MTVLVVCFDINGIFCIVLQLIRRDQFIEIHGYTCAPYSLSLIKSVKRSDLQTYRIQNKNKSREEMSGGSKNTGFSRDKNLNAGYYCVSF